MKAAVLAWWRRRFTARRLAAEPDEFDEFDDARRLIAAIDRGGLPLNPVRVGTIARNLGLEVSRRAPVDQTIERIRACLQRADVRAGAAVPSDPG